MRIVVAMMMLFLAGATADVVRTLPGAQAGLVQFERACPIHASTDR